MYRIVSPPNHCVLYDVYTITETCHGALSALRSLSEDPMVAEWGCALVARYSTVPCCDVLFVTPESHSSFLFIAYYYVSPTLTLHPSYPASSYPPSFPHSLPLTLSPSLHSSLPLTLLPSLLPSLPPSIPPSLPLTLPPSLPPPYLPTYLLPSLPPYLTVSSSYTPSLSPLSPPPPLPYIQSRSIGIELREAGHRRGSSGHRKRTHTTKP